MIFFLLGSNLHFRIIKNSFFIMWFSCNSFLWYVWRCCWYLDAIDMVGFTKDVFLEFWSSKHFRYLLYLFLQCIVIYYKTCFHSVLNNMWFYTYHVLWLCNLWDYACIVSWNYLLLSSRFICSILLLMFTCGKSFLKNEKVESSSILA